MREGSIIINWTAGGGEMVFEIRGKSMSRQETLCVLLSTYRHLAAHMLDTHACNMSNCAFRTAHRDVLKAADRHPLIYDGRTWRYEPPARPGKRRRGRG